MPLLMFSEKADALVGIGFVIAFALSFGIGANDVANSFGTSVGSKVLSLKMACLLATICESLGAVLLGSCVWLLIATFFRLPVSGTHSIVGATIGSGLVVFGASAIQWMKTLHIAISWFASPVMSGLASMGMYYFVRFLVLRRDEPLEPGLRLLPGFYGTVVLVNIFSIFYAGPKTLHFDKIPLYGIFIISCGCGIITAVFIKCLIVPMMRRRIVDGIKLMPKWTSKLNMLLKPVRSRFTRSSTVSSDEVELKSDESTAANHDKKNGVVGKQDSLFTTAITADDSTTKDGELDNSKCEELVRVKPVFEVKPTVAFALEGNGTDANADSARLGSDNASGVAQQRHVDKVILPPINEKSESNGDELAKDRPSESYIFSSLQVVTAVFGSFAHGANDVSNAIGPLIGLWIVGKSGKIDAQIDPPPELLLYGGLGITIGLWVWGRRVIQTLGNELTQITPSSGVCIEIGSALTVLIASKLKMPISTTHCKVGSVVAVGWARSRESVNWRVFFNIIIAWVVTLPAAGLISAGVMFLFKTFLL